MTKKSFSSSPADGLRLERAPFQEELPILMSIIALPAVIAIFVKWTFL
jgi:hypothetical protein